MRHQSSRVHWEWEQLPAIVDLTADTILTATIHRGQGVEDAAQHLDRTWRHGLMRSWIERCLLHVRPLLAQATTLDEEFERIIADPYLFFCVQDAAAVRTHMYEHYKDAVNRESPGAVIRAMTAYMEYAAGDLHHSAVQIATALNERDVSHFEHELGKNSDRAQAAMLASARTLAEELAATIRECRRHYRR
jgi:hypothetical protein